MIDKLNLHRTDALSALRIMTGLLFFAHGLLSVVNFPVVPPWGASEVFTMGWFAGVLELFGGFLILLGLFTRPVAFVLSGEMAFAYFLGHAPDGFYPALNGGDAAILFCFVFLYFVFSGPGRWSLDARMGRS
jgi:putative oxidoreductase